MKVLVLQKLLVDWTCSWLTARRGAEEHGHAAYGVMQAHKLDGMEALAHLKPFLRQLPQRSLTCAVHDS
jgi:hypothetical protein